MTRVMVNRAFAAAMVAARTNETRVVIRDVDVVECERVLTFLIQQGWRCPR